jgi:hypothetical protein
VPLPDNVTVWVLFATLPELSVKTKVPVAAPDWVGLNTTPTVQLAPAANVEVPVAVVEQVPALVPVALAKGPVNGLALFTVIAPLPVFCNVTMVTALVEPATVLAKFTLAGVTVAVGINTTPVPCKATDWVLPAIPPELLVMVTLPVQPFAPKLAQADVGLKVKPIVHLAPTAKLKVPVVPDVQVPPLLAKDPTIATALLTTSADVPTFSKVTLVFTGLVAPTLVFGKVSGPNGVTLAV